MSLSELSPGVRILRKIVIIMGFVLLIGTLALFVAAYYKFTHKKPAATPSNAYAQSDSSEKCAFKPVSDVEIAGKVTNSSLNGNIITINSDKQLVLFDICRGEVLSRVNIVSAK